MENQSPRLLSLREGTAIVPLSIPHFLAKILALLFKESIDKVKIIQGFSSIFSLGTSNGWKMNTLLIDTKQEVTRNKKKEWILKLSLLSQFESHVISGDCINELHSLLKFSASCQLNRLINYTNFFLHQMDDVASFSVALSVLFCKLAIFDC